MLSLVYAITYCSCVVSKESRGDESRSPADYSENAINPKYVEPEFRFRSTEQLEPMWVIRFNRASW
jgi:hypothetical protein